jgi:hypothetical protein
VIVTAKVPVPVPKAFVAVSWTLNVPDLLGVPEIAPVVELMVKPAGRLVAAKLVGLWFQPGEKENELPTVPVVLWLVGVKFGACPPPLPPPPAAARSHPNVSDDFAEVTALAVSTCGAMLLVTVARLA